MVNYLPKNRVEFTWNPLKGMCADLTFNQPNSSKLDKKEMILNRDKGLRLPLGTW